MILDFYYSFCIRKWNTKRRMHDACVKVLHRSCEFANSPDDRKSQRISTDYTLAGVAKSNKKKFRDHFAQLKAVASQILMWHNVYSRNAIQLRQFTHSLWLPHD